MDEVNHLEQIRCRYCDALLRIPQTKQALKITCPRCHSVFYHNVRRKAFLSRNKLISVAVIVGILVLVALWQAGRQTVSGSGPSNWITISYGGLVDRSVFTHSGQSVGSVIAELPTYQTDDLKGLVQPYVEPFSILCHDALLSVNGPDTLPFVNIASHYPVGSEQPAWASLFREGHYQLYYNPRRIRIFTPGTDARRSFADNLSVLRHALRDVLSSDAVDIDTVEVYAFTNDYAATAIHLNTVPALYAVAGLDLAPRHHPVDLSAIEDFLREGVLLEAVEVDDSNNLYFYGTKSQNQTLAGEPLSLADIAVIYRSIFHYGYNAPYISLDRHEDNRFAKVNFGGHLQNTRVGQVVLEADKLFKTLSTGLDPNTHQLVTDHIASTVPDFLTEDERSLMDGSLTGHTQIRYWFYPDSIGTVTDGTIGAVLTHQFLADVERMDKPVSVGSAVRSTISHLNKNFGQYEGAFATFRELSTVGRIMALVNWLKGMGMDSRVELNDLLSVKLPAFTTPTRTKKMLAVTAAAYPKAGAANAIRENSKVYYISDLLDRYASATTDSQFLELAGTYYDGLDTDELAPPEYRRLKAQAEFYKRMIAAGDGELESLDAQLRSSQAVLDEYSSSAVEEHNRLVDKYNNLLAAQRSNINTYNAMVSRLNEMDVVSNSITSVGGGINLRPSEFKRIIRSDNAVQLREISSLKSLIRTVGKVARAGNWMRSSAGAGGARLNPVLTAPWSQTKTTNGALQYNYASTGSYRLSVSISPQAQGWQSETSLQGLTEVVEGLPGTVRVKHPSLDISGTGTMSPNKKSITFSRQAL